MILWEIFEDPRFSPGTVAAKIHFLNKEQSTEELFKKKYATHLLGVAKSLYEMSKFTIYYEIEQMLKKSESTQ